jgi:UDP:flavonoid glycosyltransferase YjiC (YdhE family)
MQAKILFIGRGFPSGGHVSTCWAIGQILKQRLNVSIVYVSYGAGSSFLRFLGADSIELPQPSGAGYTHRTFPGWELFELQDYLSPVLDEFNPNLVVCDGELYVPYFCKLRGIRCVSIASPNYISLDFGPYLQYAGLIADSLNHSSLILGYGARDCVPSALLDPAKLKMGYPPMKYDRTLLDRALVQKKYGYGNEDQLVLIYRGAGDVKTIEFETESQKIVDVPLNVYLEVLQYRYTNMKLLVVSGTPAKIPPHPNIRFASYVDFMELASISSLVIARSGRNVMYEMAYLGVPCILIGIDSQTDLYRNCEIAEQWQIGWVERATEMSEESLLKLVEQAMIPAEVERISQNGRAFVPENGISAAVETIIEILEARKESC